MALILVIDDVATMRQLVGRMLRGKHGVIEAEDGEVGIAMVQTQDPALVITDLIMPNKEGLETIQQIRRSHPNIKIIAMSGHVRPDGDSYLDAARKLGADAILAKPFLRGALLDVVDRLLNAGDLDNVRRAIG
jgi:CheY-like chemotaxis protein